ncbi:protein RESISTANCE TO PHYTOPHTHORA 1, chloroplastic-like [Telopea speciosissima]|uniref:protein RESISTANCE TO PHYTOPHTHORA 1, chloroplastic-like n=1 Tax=Telopea speciosissima TaxID=54955 RepID=UPI001CC64696|nr:protein RESISTANCE TO PHYTOPHTHORA 1, chloroplastic-like [Telopea speciosissima]
MYALVSTKIPAIFPIKESDSIKCCRRKLKIGAMSDGLETVEERGGDQDPSKRSSIESTSTTTSSATPAIDKVIKKVVQKTTTTFAPRASTATKNPTVPGTALYIVFEVQGYASMLLGGALSFNFIFPSNEPDIWRLMGMCSIWIKGVVDHGVTGSTFDCLKQKPDDFSNGSKEH